MFQKLKKFLRRSFERARLHYESFCDAERYYRAASWAGPVRRHQLPHLEAEIIKHYHVIEKGLTMADFRPRSGVDVLRRLIELIDLWEKESGPLNSFHYLAAMAVIRSYNKKHENLGVNVSDLIPERLLRFAEESDTVGGAKLPSAINPEVLACFDSIALSRHSVRNFDSVRIPSVSQIEDAVRVAISTPSVCNRQSWRVHFFTGKAAQSVLSRQNGNRGFGHLIPAVAVVTSDMRVFAGGPERYQAWIEGGLFSMTFMLALHSRGLASIALNWSRLNRDDKALRRTANIPDFERIIMLIGIGYAVNTLEVACSPRPGPERFTIWHK